MIRRLAVSRYVQNTPLIDLTAGKYFVRQLLAIRNEPFIALSGR